MQSIGGIQKNSHEWLPCSQIQGKGRLLRKTVSDSAMKALLPEGKEQSKHSSVEVLSQTCENTKALTNPLPLLPTFFFSAPQKLQYWAFHWLFHAFTEKKVLDIPYGDAEFLDACSKMNFGREWQKELFAFNRSILNTYEFPNARIERFYKLLALAMSSKYKATPEQVELSLYLKSATDMLHNRQLTFMLMFKGILNIDSTKLSKPYGLTHNQIATLQNWIKKTPCSLQETASLFKELRCACTLSPQQIEEIGAALISKTLATPSDENTFEAIAFICDFYDGSGNLLSLESEEKLLEIKPPCSFIISLFEKRPLIASCKGIAKYYIPFLPSEDSLLHALWYRWSLKLETFWREAIYCKACSFRPRQEPPIHAVWLRSHKRLPIAAFCEDMRKIQEYITEGLYYNHPIALDDCELWRDEYLDPINVGGRLRAMSTSHATRWRRGGVKSALSIQISNEQ